MRNEKYSMLIKYKTEPTITVLSPNKANLIKILTQFVYSINIRYFSPTSLPCPVALRGISPSSPVFCTAKYRGGVRRTEGLKNSDNNKPGITLLPCRAP